MNDKPLGTARIALVAAVLAAPSVARAETGPGPAPPLTLAGAMQRAREGAREVVAAQARQQAAQARSDQSKGFRWPSLNLTALWMRTNNPAEVFALKLNQGVFSFPEFVASNPNDASPLNTGITRAEIVLPLFTGGELSGRIDQAKLAADAATGHVHVGGRQRRPRGRRGVRDGRPGRGVRGPPAQVARHRRGARQARRRLTSRRGCS